VGRYASEVLAVIVCLSVRPSVCLSLRVAQNQNFYIFLRCLSYLRCSQS